MSKRFADAQGGGPRYGEPEARDTPDDPPRKATAAQLAKRSIKPMKGRSTASSRSTSPNKPLPPAALNHSFGGASQRPSFTPNGFGADTNPASQPSSFTFGASQPAPSNLFASTNQSQSFGGFGASQPSSAPTFSPGKIDFSFGGPAPSSNTNGSTPPPFSFGINSPAKPASTPSFGINSPAKPASTPSFGANPNPTSNIFGQSNPTTNMFRQSQPAPQQNDAGITDAEVKEIETAGAKLQELNKMAELERMIRDSSEKYKNGGDLAGFSPRELSVDAQRRVLNFVRNTVNNVNSSSNNNNNNNNSSSSNNNNKSNVDGSNVSQFFSFHARNQGQPNPFTRFEKLGTMAQATTLQEQTFGATVPSPEPEAQDYSFAMEESGKYSISQARKARPEDYDFTYELDSGPSKYYKMPVQGEPRSTVAQKEPRKTPVSQKDTGLSFAKGADGLYSISLAKAHRPEDFNPDDAFKLGRRGGREKEDDDTTVASRTSSNGIPPLFMSSRPTTPPYPEPDLMDGEYHVSLHTSPHENTHPYTSHFSEPPPPLPSQFDAAGMDKAEYMDGEYTAPPCQADDMDTEDTLPASQAESMDTEDTTPPTTHTDMDPMDHETLSYSSTNFFSSALSSYQNNPTNDESYIQTPQTTASAFNQTTSSAAPAFGFQASTPTAAPSNPFANLSRPPTTSTSNQPISFGAKPADSTSQTSAFGGFGASAAPASKPAEEVSYPELNGASSSQTDSPVASPAPKAPTFDFAKPTDSSKPASNGLGSSMFNQSTGQPTSFQGFGAAATPAPKQDASASVFNPSIAPKQDATASSASFKFGTSTSSASPAPQQQSVPKPGFGASFSAKPSFAPAPQQDSTPKVNFGASFAAAQPSTTPAPTPAGFGATAPSQSSSAPASFTANASGSTKPSASSGVATTQQDSSDATSSAVVKNRELNESLRAHLATCNSGQDWSHIMRYFLAEHSKISDEARASSVSDPVGRPTTSHGIPTPSEPVQAQAPAPAPMGPSTVSKRKAEDETSSEDAKKRSKVGVDLSQSTQSPNKPFSQTASLFNDILNTPPKKDAPQQAPATAPSVPSLGGFNPAPPTPKVAAPPTETPRANPFAKLTKVNNTPAAPPSQTPKPATGGFQFKAPATDPAKAAESPAASPFKINPPKPSATSTASAPTFQMPKFGGGSAGTQSFLTSFGSRAAEEEKKAQQERKEEEMDSDEDEEEWERRDAEEQAAKRKKLLEASQTAGFSFKPAAATTNSPAVFSFGGKKQTAAPPPANASNIFGHLSGSQDAKDDEDEESDEDAEGAESVTAAKSAETSSGSLFDRIEKPSNGDKTGTAGFKFGTGTSNGNSASATSPAGDNTWKGIENTPIKFGGLAKPTDSGSTTPNGSPAKQAFAGFSTSDNSKSTPKFGGFTASSIYDKPAAAPQFNFFGGSKAAEKPTPASPATSNLNSSVFAPAAKTTGFSFGGLNAGASLSAPVAAGSSTSSVFGNSTATSRATTPAGTNTDAETSGKEADPSEPSDEPSAPQNDLTALSAEQLSQNDVVFESRAKAQQFLKPAGESDAKPAWQSRGIGIFRILRNKETGKCTVLMRMVPGGKVLLNFSLLPKHTLGGTAYVVMGKMCRMAVPDEQGRMETWAAQFGTVEKVNEVVEKLIAGQPED